MPLSDWLQETYGDVFGKEELSCFAVLCERTAEAPRRLAKVALCAQRPCGLASVELAAEVDDLMQTALCMLGTEGLAGLQFFSAAMTVCDEGEAPDKHVASPPALEMRAPWESIAERHVGSAGELAHELSALGNQFQTAAEMMSTAPRDWQHAQVVIARVALLWIALLYVCCRGLYLLRSRADADISGGPSGY